MTFTVAPCRDCRIDTLPLDPDTETEYYVVHNRVWAQAGMPPRGHLCIGCLERRLRRRLTPADFTNAPINNPDAPRTQRYAWSWRTQRLQDRLEGHGLPDSRQGRLW